MKALQYEQSKLKFLTTRILSKKRPSRFADWLSCLHIRDLPQFPLPNADWVSLKTRLSGICATDLALFLGQSSTYLSPFVSFPFVPGHEIVAEVIEGGGFSPGTRVVVEPTLSCVPRGISPVCPACERGDRDMCINLDQGNLSTGTMIGFCKDTGGGWAEQFVAHKSQLYEVPAEISDESAALIEPFSVALHAVRASWENLGERCVVIGAGTIGLLTIAALRALDWKGEIHVAEWQQYKREQALRLGADSCFTKGPLEEVARWYGGRIYHPPFSAPVLVGGVDTVFSCVGSAPVLDLALRLAKSGGQVIALGCNTSLCGVDGTSIWFQRVTLRGSYIYGTETWNDMRIPTFKLALDLLSQKKADIAPLMTHKWPIEKWREALKTVWNVKGSRVIKQCFDLGVK